MEFKNTEPQNATLSIRDYVIRILPLLLTVLCAFLVIHRQNPSDESTGFDSRGAMERLKIIASKPHPTGSAEHSEVRDYILKELSALGLSPEVQNSLVFKRQIHGFDSYIAANVQNIIGRIKGANNRNAVLLACHYDSAPTSPGANDDGASVAAFLEAIKTLKTDAPPKNDVIFLFTDAEEMGLLGSEAFMNEHPYAKDVAIALNFEARGASGPSIMFETSERNEWLIKEFAKVAERPVANSFTYSLYRLTGYSTDMAIFKDKGLQGLNFAYISGGSHFHTARDSYENTDERSLRHQGSYVLALARHFGNLSEIPRPARNSVYFDIFSFALFTYSEIWVLPLMGFGLALFAGVVILGYRMRRLTIRGMAFGAVGFLLNVVIVGALIMVSLGMVRRLSSNPNNGDDNSGVYGIGFLCLTVALSSALLFWYRKKTSVENLIVGALFWWVVAMVIVCLLLPGGSYLFTWPALLTALALGAVFISKAEITSPKCMLIFILPAFSGVLMGAPLIRLSLMGFGVGYAWALMSLVVFLFALHYTHVNSLLKGRAWLLPAASGLAGICIVGAGILKSDIDINHPKPSHIIYGLQADTGKASWFSLDRRPDEWTSQFFSSGAERGGRNNSVFWPWNMNNMLQGEAPAVSLAAPSVVVLGDKTENGLRALHLRVTSHRHAPVIAVYWKRELELSGIAVDGKRLVGETPDRRGGPTKYQQLVYFSPQKEGFDLNLEIKTASPLELIVEDRSFGLPDIPNGSYKGRPNHIVPAPAFCSDCTIVEKSAAF